MRKTLLTLTILSVTAFGSGYMLAEAPVDMTTSIKANRFVNEWGFAGDTRPGWDGHNVIEFYNVLNSETHQILENMPAGKYTLRFNGFYRFKGNHTSASDTDEINGFFYLKSGSSFSWKKNQAVDSPESGDVYTYGKPLKSLYSETIFTYEPYTFPNSMTQAYEAFADGLYENEATCDLENDGILRFGIVRPTQWRADREWICAGNFRLFYKSDDNVEEIDMTYRIANNDFRYKPESAWSSYPVTIDDETAINASVQEWYRKAIDMTQTITGLEAGRYRVTLQGFRRDFDEACLVANSEKVQLMDYWSANDKVENLNVLQNIAGAGTLFDRNLYLNNIFVELQDGEDLTIGLSKTGTSSKDWVAAREFRLYYLPPIEAPGHDQAGETVTHDFNESNKEMKFTLVDGVTVYYKWEDETTAETVAYNVPVNGYEAIPENGIVCIDKPGIISYYAENTEGQRSEIKTVIFSQSTTTGIDDVTFDCNFPVEYYNLQGIRIDNPANGNVVIARQGNKVKKIVIR